MIFSRWLLYFVCRCLGLNLHFTGRNRNHQGLAAAILQIWEKSLIAKIAVKRGIQNTNNKLMADEVKVSLIFFSLKFTVREK